LFLMFQSPQHRAVQHIQRTRFVWPERSSRSL
jgi:hypothetical protein